MRRFFRKNFNRFFNKDLPFRTLVFNVLELTGIVLSVFSAVNAAFSMNPILVIASLSAGVAAVIMMYLYTLTRFQLPIKIITVTVVFYTIFPLMFLEIGTYGMIIFFLGILFSSVLFEKKKNAIMVCAILMAYYSGFIIIANYPPININKPDWAEIRMQLMTFLLVSGAVAATVIWLVDAYEKQAEILKKHNDEKVEFFSIFSHEINTPLTAINGFAQLGERISNTDGNFSEKDITQIQTSFARIYRASEHLKRMSRQLLEVTMLDQGVIRVNLAPCDFSDIIEQVQTQFEAGEHGNELVITKTENLPLFCADPDKFIQVFLNLIQNADKHTENGKISIWAATQNENLLFHVKDTGTGIQEELIPYLFKKYPQTITDGIKTDHGLGLYICKVYVNAMRGEISLVKTSNEGTEFMISLPAM